MKIPNRTAYYYIVISIITVASIIGCIMPGETWYVGVSEFFIYLMCILWIVEIIEVIKDKFNLINKH